MARGDATSLGHIARRNCKARHQGNVHKESQGFGEIKTLKVEGTVGIANGDGILKMAGHDEDMSLGLCSVGEESIKKMQILKVVKDQQPGGLRLE